MRVTTNDNENHPLYCEVCDDERPLHDHERAAETELDFAAARLEDDPQQASAALKIAEIEAQLAVAQAIRLATSAWMKANPRSSNS